MPICQKPTAQEYMSGMLLAGKCARMEDLWTLSSRIPLSSTTSPPKDWYTINTPLKIDEWWQQLREHSDPDFVAYILRGITEGFWIGFNNQDYTCESAKRNMKSAVDNPQVVREYLALESKLGRIEGPLNLEMPGTINWFGVIPKPH